MKLLLAVLLFLSLCCAVRAQYAPTLNGVPGCGPMVPGGVFMGEFVPGGCEPMVPVARVSSGPPPGNCQGVVDASAGCPLPMINGI